MTKNPKTSSDFQLLVHGDTALVEPLWSNLSDLHPMQLTQGSALEPALTIASLSTEVSEDGWMPASQSLEAFHDMAQETAEPSSRDFQDQSERSGWAEREIASSPQDDDPGPSQQTASQLTDRDADPRLVQFRPFEPPVAIDVAQPEAKPPAEQYVDLSLASASDGNRGIIGRDDRYQTADFSSKPLNATVGIDVGYNYRSDGIIETGTATGIMIGTGHVLTAAHNLVPYEAPNNQDRTTPPEIFDNSRVTLAENVPTMPQDRRQTADPNFDNARGPVLLPREFQGDYARRSDFRDIAVIQTDAPLIPPQEAMGMLVFMDGADLEGRAISTAGYPFDKPTDPPFPFGVNPNDQKTLWAADGIAGSKPDRSPYPEYFYLSETIDIAAGQSGSGVWTTYEDGADPLVVGVVTTADDNNPDLEFNAAYRINKNFYDDVVAQIGLDTGFADADLLPENTIVGTDSTFWSSGDDLITGSYRREQLIGQGGDDVLAGAGGGDRLDGGDGLDRATYAGAVSEYLVRPFVDATGAYDFTISHTGGLANEGTDRLKNVELATFKNGFSIWLKQDEEVPTKLADGPEHNTSTPIIDAAGEQIGAAVVKAPSWSYDGDVRYELSLGNESAVSYNFALVIDSSLSMQEELDDAIAAYVALVRTLEQSGVAANSTFNVINFTRGLDFTGPVNSTKAIEFLEDINVGFGTSYLPALDRTISYFRNEAPPGSQNVAYFLSDGDPRDPVENDNDEVRLREITSRGETLQEFAEVRAFGLGIPPREDGQPDPMRFLNAIDSDQAVRLQNVGQLADAFDQGGVGRDAIARIDVKLDGAVIDTISPDDLETGPLGLTYRGEIDGLEVSMTARNIVEFDIVLIDGSMTTTTERIITAGQQTHIFSAADGTRNVLFSVDQIEFDAASADDASISSGTGVAVTANDLSNEIRVNQGENTLNGLGGDDLFVVSGGTAAIDGGDGIDTVRFDMTRAEADLTKVADLIRVGETATLANVEFAAFEDGLVDLSDLSTVAQLRLATPEIEVIEGQAGENTFVDVRLELLHAVETDTVIQFNTTNLTAELGFDFSTAGGRMTIRAGETSAVTRINILGDDDFEIDEAFEITFNAPQGALFGNGTAIDKARIDILTDESFVSLGKTNNQTIIQEGDERREEQIIVSRIGDLSEEAVVRYRFTESDRRVFDPNDYFDGDFPSGEIVFEPGQQMATIQFAFKGNERPGDGGRFRVELAAVSDNVKTESEPVEYIIQNDDRPGRDHILHIAGESDIAARDDVFNLAHTDTLALDEGTIALSFNADTVLGLKTLLSKDARFFGDGGHISLYVEDGDLILRVQDTEQSYQLNGGAIQAGQDYNVAISFGADGLRLHRDGEVVDQSDARWSLANNAEYLQIGGLGWASEDDDRASFTNIFDGQINDVFVFDRVLTAEQTDDLIGSPSVLGFDRPFELTADTDVINMTHTNRLALDEGAFMLAFVADDIESRQGLISKDAEGAGPGGEMSVFIENGHLIAQIQQDGETYELRHEGVQAGALHHVALSFDDTRLELYLDGVLVDFADDASFSLVENNEHLQFGALGWQSGGARPDDLATDTFQGKMGAIQVFDQYMEELLVQAEMASGSQLWTT